MQEGLEEVFNAVYRFGRTQWMQLRRVQSVPRSIDFVDAVIRLWPDGKQAHAAAEALVRAQINEVTASCQGLTIAATFDTQPIDFGRTYNIKRILRWRNQAKAVCITICAVSVAETLEWFLGPIISNDLLRQGVGFPNAEARRVLIRSRLNPTLARQQPAFVKEIGRGLGRIAAHEVMHALHSHPSEMGRLTHDGDGLGAAGDAPTQSPSKFWQPAQFSDRGKEVIRYWLAQVRRIQGTRRTVPIQRR